MLVRLATAAIALALIGGVAIHTPIVRDRALSAAASWLSSHFDLLLRADSLDYNLFTLRGNLTNLSLANRRTPDRPFFKAARVDFDVAWASVWSPVHLWSVEISRPRIVLAFNEDGTNNLPAFKGGSNKSGGGVTIDRIVLSEADLTYDDRPHDLKLDLQRLRLTLGGRIPADVTGRLSVGAPGSLALGSWHTTLTRVTTGFGFDRNGVHLDDTTIGTTEGDLAVRGRMGWGLDGALGLTVGGHFDTARSLRATGIDLDVSGPITSSGTVSGTWQSLRVALDLRSTRIGLGTLPTGTLASSVVISRPGIDLTATDVIAPWGRLNATGHFAFAHRGPSDLRAAWSGLDALAVRAVTSPEMPIFASRLKGSGSLRWTKPGLAALDIDASTQFEPTGARGLPLGGSAKVSARQGVWTVDHALTTANAVAFGGAITIGVGSAQFVQSSLSGRTRVTGPSLQSLVSVAQTLGVPSPGAFVSTLHGPVDADVMLRGRLIDPTAEADFVLPALVIEGVGRGTARGHAIASRSSQGVTTADVTIGGSHARATNIEHAGTGTLSGSLALTSSNVSPLISWLSPAIGPGIAGAVETEAELSGTTDTWQLQGHVEGTNINAAGQHVDRLSSDYTVRGDRVDFTSLDATAGSGQMQGRGWYGLESGEQALDLTLRGFPLTKCDVGYATCLVTVPGSAVVSGVISTSGAIAHPTGHVQLTAADASWGEAQAGSLEGAIDARAGAGRFTLGAPDLHLNADGTFALGEHPRLDAVLHALDVDLADIQTRAGRPALAERVRGRLTGAVSFGGDPLSPRDGRVTLDLDPASLTVTPNAAQPTALPISVDRALHAELSRGRIAVEDLAAHVGAATVTGSGALDANDPQARLTLRVDGAAKDLTDVASAAGFDKVLATAGHVSIALSATGAPDAPHVTATAAVDGGALQMGTTDVSGLRARAALGPDGLTVEQAAAQWGDIVATATGRAPLTWLHELLPWIPEDAAQRAAGVATMTAHVAGDLGKTLAARVPRGTSTSGSLDATIELSASNPRLDAVTGSITLAQASVAVGGAKIEQASEGRVRIARGRADLDPWTLTGSRSNLAISGSANLAGDQPTVDLRLSGPLGLPPLQPLIGMPIAGTLVSDLTVRGPVMAPLVDGTVRIDNAALRIATPRLSFTGVSGNILFRQGRAAVDDVTGEANGAPILIRGAYDLSGATPPTLSFTAVSVPIQMVADGPRAEVDVDVQYAVANGKPMITGAVSFLPQPYRGSILALRNVITQLQQIYGAPTTGGSRRNARRQTTPVGLDIAVKSTDTLNLDTNVGRVELSADLRLQGTLDTPALLGTIALGEGGQLRAGGRTYRVERGTVTFSNPRRIEPVLDVTADTHIGSYDVTMTLTGSTDALRTSLRSDPPLAESDLRSLLVTGRTASESARRGDIVDQQRVVESLSSDLFGFAAQAVGLDAVSIGVPDLDLIAGGIDASTSLNIKKSLTSQVELVFSQDLQKGRLSWLATYRPLRSTSLRLVSREGRSGAVEVRQERTFGGGTKRPPPSKKKAAPKLEVSAVTFRGLTGTAQETLRKQVHLEPSDRFDVWKLQEDSTRLLDYYHKLGYLQAQVRSLHSASDAGVSIEHDIRRGPRSILTIEGHKFPGDVLERMNALWGEALTDEFLADDLARLARRHLIDDGFMNARVTVTTVESTHETLAFKMSVEPGDQVKTRTVVFSGNEALKEVDLLAVLTEGDLERSAWYDPETLEQPLAAAYRRQGYLDAKIDASPVRVVGTRAELPVTITEGRPYRIASIDVRGARARPLPEIQRIIGITPGSQLRVAEIREARLRLQRFYVEQGFDDADVRVQPTIDRESATVSAVFNVSEGQRRVVDDLRIAGNQETLTKIISDFADLQAGTAVTSALVSDLQKRLYDTGVFSSVAVTFEPVAPPPTAPAVSRDTGAPLPAPAATGAPDPDRVVTVVTVEEAPRYSVRYGVQMTKSLEATGTESQYAPGAGADFRDRNLFGRAIAAGVGIRGDRNSQSVQGLLGIQRTYGMAIRSNLFLNAERDHQGELGPYRLDERDASVVLEQRTRLKTPLELSWALAYENRHNQLIDRPTNVTLLVIDGVTVGPRVALTRDTRDNPFDATHGLLDSAAVDFGIRGLGSDLGYSRVLLQHFQFVPIHKIVLATGVRIGSLVTAGEATTLGLDLQFKAGGSRTVRGYPEDSLGPPGILGLFGNSDLFIVNQEIRFPIWKWFKGVAFVDAGNTFPSLSDVRLDALKVGTGGGLRLATPVGLFRVDLGYPVSAGTRRTPRWYFSIGQAF